MSGHATRIGVARFTQELNQATTVGNVATAITAGTLVPDGFRHEFAHLSAEKNCTATVAIYGLANVRGSQRWLLADMLSFAYGVSEVALVSGIAAFHRVQTVVNVIGSGGAINTHWGFSE